jgi:hypothetical protein
MTSAELYSLMLRCNGAQLTAITTKLELNPAYLPDAAQPIATRATEILNLAQQRELLPKLEEALLELFPRQPVQAAPPWRHVTAVVRDTETGAPAQFRSIRIETRRPAGPPQWVAQQDYDPKSSGIYTLQYRLKNPNASIWLTVISDEGEQSIQIIESQHRYCFRIGVNRSSDALSKLAAVNRTEKLRSDKAGAFAVNRLNQIQDMLVMAARQELDAVRRCLDELGFTREEHFLDSRMVETFRMQKTRRGDIVVGLMLPLQKAKSGMKSLLEAIKAHSSAQHVLMVGMMAGIKDKVRLLDVLAPLTVYDVTQIGTRGEKFIVEPGAGTMDARLHNLAAFIDPINFRDPSIRLITHKNTVTFSAKIDDITHELAAAALNVDPENVVGLEMEGSALIEMQNLKFDSQNIRYLMIKGVADYAGERPDKAEVRSLANIASIKEHLSDPDPTEAIELKAALQREATRRALFVALELLTRLPPNT